jgi:hypothetical protein
MKKVVSVWGEDYEVSLSKNSQRRWTASGDYLGDIVSEMDRSSRTALKRWKEAAICMDYYRLPRARA